MGAEYTKGSWQISPTTPPRNEYWRKHSLTIIAHTGGIIARAVHRKGTYRKEAEANARLIASAPEMYEELKAAEWVTAPFKVNGVDLVFCPQCAGLQSIGHTGECSLRAALDKAERGGR